MIFVIVGSREPLFEAEFGSAASQGQSRDSHLNQFILHSSLDLVEKAAWTTNAMNLRTVDRFNDLVVSAFLTSGNVKFLLLHEGRNEDNIRSFFLDVHELFVKVLLSPFYERDSPILSPHFDKRVRALAKRL